jgi:hypothetical protein
MLAGGHNNVHDFNANLSTTKAMRTTGQSIFLAINAVLLYCILSTIRSGSTSSDACASTPIAAPLFL